VIVDSSQRWRDRRPSRRPAGELINPRAYEVAAIPDDTTAKRFVLEHHYSGSFVNAIERFGLYRGEALVGVAVFSRPQNDDCLNCLPGGRETGIELGRLVLLDDVEGNGETWYLARCFEQLRRLGYRGVVSFSDPIARTDLAGALIFPGHAGTIYQAHNAVFLGRTKSETKRLLPDGTVIPARTLNKIKKSDKGWRYAAELLERHGAEPLRPCEDGAAWLVRWLPIVTRPFKHAGNLKYAWALLGRDRKHLPPSKPYIKLSLGQLPLKL
jgi:hypothetical protein